jgi:hypothetical protein
VVPCGTMITKLLVKKLLEKPYGLDWSFQGLGMLRTYLSKEVRLHIWDPRRAFPNVSTLHTHPWNFQSQVVAGRLVDKIYDELKGRTDTNHHKQMIQCGPGGCAKGEIADVRLALCGQRTVGDSKGSTGYQQSYALSREAIHESLPEPGTVTIIERQFSEDSEHAYVFWPLGTDWVSAEPRAATFEEIQSMTCTAMEWFR